MEGPLLVLQCAPAADEATAEERAPAGRWRVVLEHRASRRLTVVLAHQIFPQLLHLGCLRLAAATAAAAGGHQGGGQELHGAADSAGGGRRWGCGGGGGGRPEGGQQGRGEQPEVGAGDAAGSRGGGGSRCAPESVAAAGENMHLRCHRM